VVGGEPGEEGVVEVCGHDCGCYCETMIFGMDEIGCHCDGLKVDLK
jgi:hypothetical protein